MSPPPIGRQRIHGLRTLRLCLLGALVLLGLVALADAQQPAKVPRIGFLSASSPSSNPHLLEAFQQGLRELGYVESQNIAIEYRWAEGRLDRLPQLAAELVRMRVDIIVASVTATVRAAKQATNTIPIVMLFASDPVGDGLVASLARPDGNIPGLAAIAQELRTYPKTS